MKKGFVIKNDADYDKVVREICNSLAKVSVLQKKIVIVSELQRVRKLLNSIWYYKISEVK